MDPLEPDVDPWRDTEEGRGEERDNPLDSGAAGTPFGADPESVGIPNFVYRPQGRSAAHTSKPPLSRGILLLWLLAPLVGLIVSLYLALT